MTDIEPLRDLARLLTAEAAFACGSLAGAVTVAAAACIAGEDLAAVLRLPDAGGRERRVVLQRAQARALGGLPVLQLLRFAGAVPVEVGTADAADEGELAAALGEGAAAGLLVAGGAPGAIPLAPFARACRVAGVPVVVVGDAGLSPITALDAGADLALADASALVAAPPLGLIVGRAGLVRAAALQRRGIGGLVPAEAAAVAACVEALRAAADPAGAIAVPTFG